MNGSIIEIPLGGSNIGSLTLGPDGNIWLSQGNWGKIVEVAP